MSDAPRKDSAEAAPPPKGRKKLVLIGAAAALLLAGGGGGAWFFLRPKGDDEGHGDSHKPVEPRTRTFANLDPFTVNLADPGGERFVQVTMVLEVADAQTSALITANMPAIRSAILMILSARNSQELLTVTGKEQLATMVAISVGENIGWEKPVAEEPKEGKDAVEGKTAKGGKSRKTAPNPIQGVHFSHFIVQ